MQNSTGSGRNEISYRVKVTRPDYVAAAVILAAIVIVLARLLLTPGNLHDGDLNFPLSAAAHLREHYPIWNPAGYGNEPLAARLFFHLPFVVVTNLFGGDGGAYAKLIVFATVAGGGLSAYAAVRILAQLFVPRHVAAHPRSVAAGGAVSGLFYVLNPWWLAQLEHIHIVAGLALAPLAFALFVRGLMHDDRRGIVLAALIEALITSITPHTGLLTLSLLAAAAAYHTAVGFTPGEISVRFRAAARVSGLFAVVYLLVSAFAWLPLLASLLAGGPSSPPGYLFVEQDSQLLVRHQTWPNTVRLIGNWLWNPVLRPAGDRALDWEFASLVPLAALLAGMVAIRALWRPLAFLLMVAGGAALLISTTTSSTFDQLFPTSVVDIPLGWIFREPDRGSWFLVLAYTLGAGLGLTMLLGWFARRYRDNVDARRLATAIALAFAALILIVYTTPAIRGVLWSESSALQPRIKPPEYAAAKSRLNALTEREAGRILVLSTSGQRFWSAGRRVDGFLARSLKQRSVSNMTALGRTFSRKIEEIILAGENPQELMLEAGITLVVVEADYPLGQTLRFGLANLPYQMFVPGTVLAVFEVPSLRDPRVAAAPSAPVGVWSGVRLVEGFPTPTADAIDLPAVITDQLPLPAATIDALQSLRVGPGPDDLTIDNVPGLRLVSLLDATLNADPANGWARARAMDVTYSRWRSTLAGLGLSNWQFDYGLGLLFTLGNRTIRADLPADLAPGSYRAWARVFTSPAGGRLRISLWDESAGGGGPQAVVPGPDQIADLGTFAPAAEFSWIEIGAVEVSGAGAAAVTLESLSGFKRRGRRRHRALARQGPFP